MLKFQKLFAQNVSYRLILESGLELARPLEVELMLEFDPDLDEDLDEERPLERFSEDSVGDTSRDPLLLQIMSWINFCHNQSLVKFFSTCMCWDIKSMATVFSAPRGTITSAYFFVGRQNSSKAGFTRVVY